MKPPLPSLMKRLHRLTSRLQWAVQVGDSHAALAALFLLTVQLKRINARLAKSAKSKA